MYNSLGYLVKGYEIFRDKYASQDNTILKHLASTGQKPKAIVIACCDSRVDPGLIFQCDPGDLFVVRNVANIVPPYQQDGKHHGTSAALEFAIKHLGVKNIIILGHSQCGGVQSLLNKENDRNNDFIDDWMSSLSHHVRITDNTSCEDLVKSFLQCSYDNCMSFPWISEKVRKKDVAIHRWFFEIATGMVYAYNFSDDKYYELSKSYKLFSDE